jgi:DNA-binding transcriptional regulator YiaG
VYYLNDSLHETPAMANIGTLLKQEISRLSRRETKGQTGAIKRATAQFRHDIAALKRKVAELERHIGLMSKSMASRSSEASTVIPEKRARFVPKGLKSLRARLGLSAAELGQILGVSAQSVYNWEHGVTRPRASQFAKLASLRGVNKKEIHSQLRPRAPAARKSAKSGSASARRSSAVARSAR